MTRTILFLLGALALNFTSLSAQEQLTGLRENFKIKKHGVAKQNIDTQALYIPFIDDFSGATVFPDDSLWSDANAFVNDDFPINAPSKGVATLDALDSGGNIYSYGGTYPFIADYLTSNYIRLDSTKDNNPISPADSIYLSFMFQPAGIGNAPESNDSIALDFLLKNDQGDSTWNRVWGHSGMSVDTFYNRYNTYFKKVMIPITNAQYFTKFFSFRFVNYASLSSQGSVFQSNVDQWHLDYVYLDKNRSYDDTLIFDVAMTGQLPSFLKNYYQMPWNQYKEDELFEMKPIADVYINNIDTNILSFDYSYNVFIENDTNAVEGYNFSDNVFPYHLSQMNSYSVPAGDAFAYNNPLTPDDSSTYFRIIHKVDESGSGNDFIPQNDTAVFIQKFYNYYAYDDGNPENGYVLNTNGNTGKIAYKFSLNKTDTLKAIAIFFNKLLVHNPDLSFDITVWQNIEPNEEVIFKEENVIPIKPDGLNKYFTYDINGGEGIEVSNEFYVGWETTSNLNVGFDRNHNAKDNIFYYLNGNWSNTSFEGALMIRPIFSKTYCIGIQEDKTEEFTFKVFPNPIRGDRIRIKTNATELVKSNLFLRLFDSRGQLIYMGNFSEVIKIPQVSPGLYLFQITNSQGLTLSSERLLIDQH